MMKGEDSANFADNPNCEETHATLRFVDKDLDPNIITSAFGIQPDEAHKRGDKRISKSGKEYPYPRGVWYLTTTGWPSRNLEAHIVRLLDRVEPVAEVVRRIIQEHPSYRFEIICYWMSATGQGGPSFSPSTLSRIAALGATLDFDIYSAV
jgi:hypothetical protein